MWICATFEEKSVKGAACLASASGPVEDKDEGRKGLS